MSHITKCKLSIELKDKKTLEEALKLMEKEGFKVLTTEKGFKIDLSSKGINHRYGKEFNYITLEKSGDQYIAKGDRWSINEGYDMVIKTLEKSYTIAGINQALKMQGFMTPSITTAEKTTHKTMGKTIVKAMKW